MRITVSENVPERLVGDGRHLRRVLANLIGNAVKFTETGSVSVDVAATHVGLDEIVIAFAVRDTGIGIAADQQQMIFKAFTQQDTSSTRTYGGTGLGLAIAARLVAMMSGEITVASEPGRGSTFTVSARFTYPSKPVTPSAELLAPAVLLAACAEDPATLEQLATGLQNDLPGILADTQASFDRGDARAVRDNARRIRERVSIASTVVATIAAELEAASVAHRLETTAALLARLDLACRRLLASLVDISIAKLRDEV
ncbi:MAG TPA: ATP-binding protein [Kofleriaceae bacterium]